MTRRPVALASLPASVRARNRQLFGATEALPMAPTRPAVAPAATRRPAGRPAPAAALPGAQGAVVVELPGLRLVNPLNNRQGWHTVSRRGTREKAATWAALTAQGPRTPPALPLLVTIVRVSMGRMDDDGCTASAKHVRDTVAKWLGCDDGDARVRFVVTQEHGKAGVRIEVTPMVARRAVCPSCGCAVDVDGGER